MIFGSREYSDSLDQHRRECTQCAATKIDEIGGNHGCSVGRFLAAGWSRCLEVEIMQDDAERDFDD